MSLSTKSKEKVFNFFSPRFSLTIADTRLESNPPERNVHIGISDTICLFMLSFIR